MYNLVLIFKILFDGITHPECKYLLRASMCWHPWDFYKFQIECSGWLHLRPNYLKLWKERFKNPLFKIWTYIILLTKSKSLTLFRREQSPFEILMPFHFHNFFHAIICPFVPLKESGWMEAIDSNGQNCGHRNTYFKIVLENNQYIFHL